MQEDKPVNEVALARFEGKLDRIMDRTARTETDMADVRLRLNGHSNRITALETSDKVDKAERNGALQIVRLLWAILGTIGIGGGLTILQATGLVNIGG